MTEKQGGSDVRANTTVATPLGPAGRARSTCCAGHKWFTSAPMCDLFLVLAQTDEGVGLLRGPADPARRHPQPVPPAAPEGQARQPLQRLVGGGVRRHLGAPGRRAGRGVRTIIEMVGHTRLDCVIGSAAGMRWPWPRRPPRRPPLRVRAHAVEQPLMRNVLADLARGVEAATVLAMRLARAYDEEDPGDAPPRHRGGQVTVCKRFPGRRLRGAGVPGGNGYVEESGMPRLYRESPLNSSGRARATSTRSTCLRALAKEPGAFDVFWGRAGRGARPRRALRRVESHGLPGARSPSGVDRAFRGAAGCGRTWRRLAGRCSCAHAPHHVAGRRSSRRGSGRETAG
jgi:putative acyl-CoA dehydrogenase